MLGRSRLLRQAEQTQQHNLLSSASGHPGFPPCSLVTARRGSQEWGDRGCLSDHPVCAAKRGGQGAAAGQVPVISQEAARCPYLKQVAPGQVGAAWVWQDLDSRAQHGNHL